MAIKREKILNRKWSFVNCVICVNMLKYLIVVCEFQLKRMILKNKKKVERENDVGIFASIVICIVLHATNYQ